MRSFAYGINVETGKPTKPKPGVEYRYGTAARVGDT